MLTPRTLEEAAAVRRPPCTACEAVRSAWARGGWHLSCRACEVSAVTGSPVQVREAFYRRLVADARAVQLPVRPGGSASRMKAGAP